MNENRVFPDTRSPTEKVEYQLEQWKKHGIVDGVQSVMFAARVEISRVLSPSSDTLFRQRLVPSRVLLNEKKSFPRFFFLYFPDHKTLIISVCQYLAIYSLLFISYHLWNGS